MKINSNTLHIKKREPRVMYGEVVFQLEPADVQLLLDWELTPTRDAIREFFIEDSRLTQLNRCEAFIPYGYRVDGWEITKVDGLLVTVAPHEITLLTQYMETV